ncbi:mitochondrial protein [Suillus subalutaceus]|uniref:mitochondrial protein n=1 Tax=Suillus subalutaceus TaxID=48586 RepID=UPI001B8859C4|nr:mitochondrial protein [Suillus subalutaceus]KAG1861114.1 mitochondrial protein [Suillus subalutaceus]
MSAIAQKILVVGGNGFVGSAVCKAALARGMGGHHSSGKPYRTPKGHTPDWAEKVLVHTIGTLLDNTQRNKLFHDKDFVGLLKSITGISPGAYEKLNRDTAIRMCEAFTASKPTQGITQCSTDFHRPIISVRYMETKLEAEKKIDEIMKDHPQYRAVHVRPSMIYDPETRPMTIPVNLFTFSAWMHAAMPSFVPMPASIVRWLGTSVFPKATEQTPSALVSMATLLSVPPISVDHLAEAICVSLDPAKNIRGPVGVRAMRELIGWSKGGPTVTPNSSSS